jgi:hypothetical protein
VTAEIPSGWPAAATGRAFTPELTEALAMDADLAASVQAEGRSKVTFDIVPHGGRVKLTVTQDQIDPDSRVVTMVETGEVLPD